MTIRTRDVVYCVVARGGAVIAVQDNFADVLATGLVSTVWGVVSAITGDGAGVDVGGSVAIDASSDTANVYISLGLGNPTLNAAILAGDTLAMQLSNGGVTQPEIIHVHLRPISTIDFLLLQNGQHTPVSVLATPNYNPYQWALTAGAGLGAATFTAVPDGTSLALSFATPPPSFNIDNAQFQLTLTANHTTNPFSNSVSQFGLFGAGPSQPTIAVRALEKAPGVPLAGYTYFRNHLNDGATGAGINAAPPAGNTITGAVTGGPGDWPTTLTLDPLTAKLGPVNEVGVVSWTAAAAALKVIVHDPAGVRPDAFVTGLSFRMRELTADPTYQLTIPFDVVMNARNLVVAGGDPFTFLDATVSGGTSTIGSSLVPVPQIQWGAFALRAGDALSLHVTLDSGAAGFPNESFTIPIAVTTPAMATITVSPGTLPTARQKIRYQTTLTASVAAAAGQQLEWYLEATETTDMEFGAATTTAATNPFRTKALHVIPAAWAAGNRSVPVHVVLRDTGTNVVLATTDAPGPAHVILPIAQTRANVNSVLMVDRSGSMGAENRWTGAMSGVQLFAALVKDRNTNIGTTHGVQAMWFGGWDDVPTPNYPSPQPPTDPLGAGNYGTLQGDGGAGVIALDFTHFANDASFNAALIEAATRQQPFFWTAIGSGLLAAKDALLAGDPPHNKERVVFVFTDGMENRVPFVNEATLADASGGTFWEHPDPALGLPNGDPQTRVYACALGTAQSFADQMKPACDNTGGIGALDVKFIPSGSSTSAISTAVQNWFNSSFAMMFGYTSLTAPDPQLASGATDAQVVKVTEGHTQVVFSLFVAEPSPNDWTFEIQPPGGTTVITQAAATSGALGPGVRFYQGTLHKTFVVDLPLSIPGEASRWAGDWTAYVTRNAQTTGEYLFSAIAQQDITFQVALDMPAPTRVGNRVDVRAYMALRDAPLTTANIVAHVRSPGRWVDDPIARRAGLAFTMPAAGPPVGGRPPAVDLTHVQGVARAVLGTTTLDQHTIDVPLAHVGGGFYTGSFIVDQPGTWEVHTVATGTRSAPRDWTRWERVQREMVAILPPRLLEAERVRLSLVAGGAQAFQLEDDQTLGVTFVPDLAATRAGGMLRPNELDLFVVPKDAQGNLLGIGRERDVVFHAGCGGVTWPSIDLGNGTYAARIPLRGQNLRPVRDVLVGENIVLGDGKHALPICTGRVDLTHFFARVLGLEVPVPVRAPILGKLARTDLEHAFPSFAISLGVAASSVARLEKEEGGKLASAPGVAELLATLRRAVDVDFARTAAALAARRYGLEVARQALCTYCRKAGRDPVLGKLTGELEAVLDATLERWPAAHLAEQSHCRDAFFADADELRGLVQRVIAHVVPAAGQPHTKK